MRCWRLSRSAVIWRWPRFDARRRVADEVETGLLGTSSETSGGERWSGVHRRLCNLAAAPHLQTVRSHSACRRQHPAPSQQAKVRAFCGSGRNVGRAADGRALSLDSAYWTRAASHAERSWRSLCRSRCSRGRTRCRWSPERDTAHRYRGAGLPSPNSTRDNGPSSEAVIVDPRPPAGTSRPPRRG